MNLDIVLIDMLAPDGVLTSYKITPTAQRDLVTVDRLRDIHPDRFNDADIDVAGTRIYGAKSCSITKIASKIRAFESFHDGNSFRFQFEHMGVPVGPSKHAHGGIYNFVLSPGWRCNEIFVSDPYDQKNNNVSQKKQFRFSVVWDPQCSTQMVEMQMRSGRGSFSFIVAGTATLIANAPPEATFVEAHESAHSTARLMNPHILDNAGRKELAKDVANRADWSDWIELKPNLFGIGLNVKAMAKDAIRLFQKKIDPSH